MRTILKGTHCELIGLSNDGVLLFDRKKKIEIQLLKEKESVFQLPDFQFVSGLVSTLAAVHFFALNFHGSLDLQSQC